MTQALPWRVSGIEPDIRDDALHAAHGAGMTLGQWLNGVIRDSLVDLDAAQMKSKRTAGARPHVEGRSQAPHPQPQQEMASHTMPPFTAQQQPQFAPQPWQMGHQPPPYMQPQPQPYMQPQPMPYYPPQPVGYPQYPMAYAPPAPAYDPLEARLRHYAQATETAIPVAQQDNGRVLSVIDAAVRSSESKTAAAIEALARLVEQTHQQSRAAAPAPKSDTSGINEALAGLVERFSALESSLSSRADQRDTLSRAQHQESRIGDALDMLGRDSDHAAPSGRPSQPRAPGTRPRINVVRGNTAVADIAARQRMLDQPQASYQPQASASTQAESAALEAIKRSIAALSDQVREVSQESARQSEFDVRGELKDLQKSVQDLAPRRIVASVNESIRGLAQKIEQSRQEGVRESNLAPIEKLLADMRVAIDEVREPKALGSVNEALERLSHRVEDIGARSISGAQIDDIQRQFGEIRMLISQAQRQQPVDDLQEQIAQLSVKLDGLAERPRDGKAVAIVASAVEDVRRNLERFDPERLVARIDQRMAGLQGLEARIQELTDMVSQNQSQNQSHFAQEPSSGMAEITQRFERRLAGLDGLGARIEQLSALTEKVSQNQSHGAHEPSTGFEEITQRFERRLAGLDGLGARIEQLSAKIEEANARPANTAGFDDLTHRIERMTQSLATRQSAPDLSDIVSRIDQVREAVSRRDPAVDLSALEKRIVDMQQVIEKKAPQPDMRGLEQILRKLADRIETVRAPAASGEALDALQQHIVALAERLDNAGPAAPGLGGLERTVMDLVRQVAGLKDVAANAAQEAVRDAMGQQAGMGQAGMGMDPLAAEGMMLIKRDLTEIKNAHQTAETRSRDTLQLVNTTLEQIVSRLSTLDSKPAQRAPVQQENEPRPAPVVKPAPRTIDVAPPLNVAEGTAPRQAPPQARPLEAGPRLNAPARQQPAMPSTANADSALDMPLEPGLGRTDAAMPAGAEATSADPRANFIAAARRAAQAAAAQSSAALNDLDAKVSAKGVKAPKGETVEGASSSRMKDFIASRRKPILLGIAALVFAVGGLKVVSNLLLKEDGPVETGALQEPVLIAPSKQAQLNQRLEAGLAQLAKKQTAELTVQAANAPTAQAQPEDKTVVGSISATPSALPAPSTAAPALPPRPGIELSTLVKSVPTTSPERLKLAAGNGNLAAVYEIGARLAEGRGVPRDLKAAAQWLEYAAEQGYAPAQYRFASFNREGLGMQADAKMAFSWFQRAAEQGHILAMHNLAVLHAEGVTGSPDYAAAAAWFRTAAEHGVKDSQFNIGILYVRGLGVGHDMNEAYKWFSAAATQGDPDAIKKRDEVASRLTGDKLAEAKALAESFHARRPDPRANEVIAPEGGWDQETKSGARGPAKKVRT